LLHCEFTFERLASTLQFCAAEIVQFEMDNFRSLFEKLTIEDKKLRSKAPEIAEEISKKYREIDQAQKIITKRSFEIKELQKTQSDLQTTLENAKKAEKDLVDKGVLLLKVLEASNTEVERVMKSE
jgi:chromosome segregation ATPase